MFQGYFILGGSNPDELPLFKKMYFGNHIGLRNRGTWVFDTDLREETINIPTRDKQVQLFFNDDGGKFNTGMTLIDSSADLPNYRAKLMRLQNTLSDSFLGAINNISTSTHGSLALVTNQIPIYVYGLYDTQLGGSYLVWADSPQVVTDILCVQPLRYLIYRFPLLESSVLFLPSEAICSKWWRWFKTHRSVLHAFNALERRLFC